MTKSAWIAKIGWAFAARRGKKYILGGGLPSFQALVRSSDMRNLRFYQPHQKHSASKRLKPPPKFALYSIRDDV